MTSPGDAARVEGVIAFARAFVSSTTLLAIRIDSTQPASYATLAYILLGGYVLVSLCVYVIVRAGDHVPRGLAPVTHALDVCVAAWLTLFTDGPNSPFFILFVYAVMAAAYRWGFVATIMTVVTTAALLGSEAVLLGYRPGASEGFVEGQFEINRLIMRVVYLGITGLLLGYLGEKELSRRQEISILSVMTRRSQMPGGIHRVLETMVGTVLNVFGATRALVILQESRGDGAMMWNVEPVPGCDRATVAAHRMEAPARERYAPSGCGEAWHMARRGWGHGLTVLDGDNRRTSCAMSPAARGLLEAHSCRAVMSVPLSVRGKRIGRMFLIDPRVGFDRESALRLAQRTADEIGVALHNVSRLRRLRLHAEHEERARIACELHDGVLQSLSGLEMRLDTVRRHIESTAPQDGEEIGRIQGWCREEAKNVRLLTRRMHAASSPRVADEDLTAIVERFQRESGILTRFVSEARTELSAPLRREVAQIVQEALVNVRKHSDANHVFVHAAIGAGRLKVSIADDGRGFPFAGRRSGWELEAMQQGPLVIRQRVKALSGRLTLESTPGKGARLDVDVPLT